MKSLISYRTSYVASQLSVTDAISFFAYSSSCASILGKRKVEDDLDENPAYGHDLNTAPNVILSVCDVFCGVININVGK